MTDNDELSSAQPKEGHFLHRIYDDRLQGYELYRNSLTPPGYRLIDPSSFFSVDFSSRDDPVLQAMDHIKRHEFQVEQATNAKRAKYDKTLEQERERLDAQQSGTPQYKSVVVTDNCLPNPFTKTLNAPSDSDSSGQAASHQMPETPPTTPNSQSPSNLELLELLSGKFGE